MRHPTYEVFSVYRVAKSMTEVKRVKVSLMKENQSVTATKKVTIQVKTKACARRKNQLL